MKKVLAVIPLIIGGLALNYLLVMGAFWSLYYEIHGASYPAAVLIVLAAALGVDCLRRLFRKKLNIKAPAFLLCAYAPSIIAAIVYRFLQAEPINELERRVDRENFLSLLIGACVLAVCGVVWLAVSGMGEKAKQVRAVFLILTGGLTVNVLVWLAAGFVGLMSGILPLFFLAGLAFIVGASVLLNLVRNKCKKLHINGAAVILCAQLPWVVLSLVTLVEYTHYYNTMHGSALARLGAGIDVGLAGSGLVTGLLIMAVTLIIANKNKIKQWWNDTW